MTARTIPLRTLIAGMLVAALGFAFALSGCAANPDSDAESSAAATGSSQGDDGAGAADGSATYGKAEVVYATLSASGSVDAVYAINRFDVESAGAIADHGAYGNVAALSENGTVSQNGDTVEISADEGVFYYQGNAGAIELPWTISIGYALDGRSVSADDLGSADGALEITVDTSRNEAVAESAFYDSFMLQITFTLPTQAARSIEAEGATVAAAGQNTTVAFAVLPGSDAHLSLSAQVEDFTMDGIQIAALPYSQAIEMPDTGEMVNGMEALSAGVDRLSDGAAQLAAGASQLAAGTTEFGDGLETLASSGGQLIDASSRIAEALQEVADALAGLDMTDAEQISQLPSLLRSAADALERQADAAHEVYLAFSQAESSLEAAIGTLREGMTATAEEIAAAVAAVEGTDAEATVWTLAASYDNARAAIDAFDAAAPAFADAEALLESIGGDDAVAAARAQAGLMRSAADMLEAGGDESLIAKLQELIDGLSDMAGRFAAFHDGIARFADGVDQLSENYSSLESGAAELASGAGSLSEGVATLAASVAQIPETMRQQIDEMMAEFVFPEFEPVSFMSAENEHVTQVQFVMATPPVAKAPDAAAEPETEQPEPTILDRVIALFE